MDLALFLLVSAVACGFLGGFVGDRRDAGLTGFLLGLLFGPIGVIAVFAIDNRRQCPHCHGRLNGRPHLCQHCGSTLTDSESEDDLPADPKARACIVCHETIPATAPTSNFKRWCDHCSDFVGTIPATDAYRNR